MREHYNAAWRATGNRPKQLEQPDLNTLVCHVWLWFTELHRVRSNTGFGPAPISYHDITAWSQLRGIKLRNWEVTALCLIDASYIKESRKASKK